MFIVIHVIISIIAIAACTYSLLHSSHLSARTQTRLFYGTIISTAASFTSGGLMLSAGASLTHFCAVGIFVLALTAVASLKIYRRINLRIEF